MNQIPLFLRENAPGLDQIKYLLQLREHMPQADQDLLQLLLSRILRILFQIC